METFQKLFLISTRERHQTLVTLNFHPALMTMDLISGEGVFHFIQKLLNDSIGSADTVNL